MRDNIQKITIDREQMSIKAGNWSFGSYNPQMITAKFVAREIACCYHSHPKERYKEANEILGMPAKRYAKVIRGMLHELWRGNKSFEPVIYDFLFVGKKPSPQWMRKLYRNEKVVQQYLDDGLYNLVPIAIATGLNTKEAKKVFGKSAWKALCNNSKSRNKLIMRSTEPFCLNEEAVEKIKNCLVKVPSTLLEKLDFSTISADLWAINKLRLTHKLKDITYREVNRLTHLYNDTMRMAWELTHLFDKSWSIRKMQEKHDEYVGLINAKKYSDDIIPWLSKLPSDFMSECEKYTAKPLKSRLAIRNQGSSQHHCVGSYSELVASGNYLVIDIKDRNDETVSTLGISVDITRKPMYTFSQHYGPCNSHVSKDLETFAKEIIGVLNG